MSIGCFFGNVVLHPACASFFFRELVGLMARGCFDKKKSSVLRKCFMGSSVDRNFRPPAWGSAVSITCKLLSICFIDTCTCLSIHLPVEYQGWPATSLFVLWGLAFLPGVANAEKWLGVIFMHPSCVCLCR